MEICSIFEHSSNLLYYLLGVKGKFVDNLLRWIKITLCSKMVKKLLV
jgi:hypothetical protein